MKTKVHTGLIIILALFIFVAIGAKITNDNKCMQEWKNNRTVITVTVTCGDTLDKLGYKYKPSWMDVREYREQVKELNNMKTSGLRAGQCLDLYVEK